MKFLDFTTLLDTEPANLAVLSTFQLDPDYFERCLLRCPALVRARRILVFMDAGQWFNLLRQDVPARFLNRRYLVVPVRRSQGVFHPKLNLLVTEQGGQVQCGSNNLTRAGCSNNLELLNSVPLNLEAANDEATYIAQEAYEFFKRVCDDAEEQTGRIARQWLEELPDIAPWIKVSLPQNDKRSVRLLHTYDGSLWDRLTDVLRDSPPRKILVISPFYDLNGEMAIRVHRRWPKCKVELLVQQQTTTLPVSPLKKLGRNVRLSELRNSSRRLHAKLLAWESSAGTGCLVGSANFTTAAFDARNVETCLLVSDVRDGLGKLFDKQLDKRPIAYDDFEPSIESEPSIVDGESSTLRLTSALLTAEGELRVTYRHRLKPKPSSLRVAIRTPDEKRPRAIKAVPNSENGTTTLNLPESALKDAHGIILAWLIAQVEGRQEESCPIWIIQEGRLTYEPSGEGSSTTKSKIEETGNGLAEFLEELGRRDGASAVIEYLSHLNIRFNDGGGGLAGGRKFQLRIRDPFQPDVAPEWMIQARRFIGDLRTALFDFADRHENQRLRRHAKRGNINGMENFLDIFSALVRLLFIYHVRGVVHKSQLIGRLCRYLEIATCGIESSEDSSEGYLNAIYDNLGGNSNYLQQVCDELNFLAHIRAAFMIVQKVRQPDSPSASLPTLKDKLKKTIKELGLEEPSAQAVTAALDNYKMSSLPELAASSNKQKDRPASQAKVPSSSARTGGKSIVSSMGSSNRPNRVDLHKSKLVPTALQTLKPAPSAHLDHLLEMSPDQFDQADRMSIVQELNVAPLSAVFKLAHNAKAVALRSKASDVFSKRNEAVITPQNPPQQNDIAGENGVSLSRMQTRRKKR
jgi:hypothetical protein